MHHGVAVTCMSSNRASSATSGLSMSWLAIAYAIDAGRKIRQANMAIRCSSRSVCEAARCLPSYNEQAAARLKQVGSTLAAAGQTKTPASGKKIGPAPNQNKERWPGAGGLNRKYCGRSRERTGVAQAGGLCSTVGAWKIAAIDSFLPKACSIRRSSWQLQ